MKRIITILMTTLLLTATLCVSASASDYDAVAEDLSVIGMFRGTDKGFELDRAPTRSEAAIMLVRLYGAEETAKTAYEAGEINHPFTDVSDFTSPYVAWLYTNGITNGFTETTFASQRPCTAQNYVAFLLRALGYQDNKDFMYPVATVFASEKGFYDPLVFSGDFLRDDLAALTYQALAADMADGKTYLLDSLIKSGAVDETAAKPMTEKITAYRAMQEAMTDTDADTKDMDIALKMDMTMTLDGESVTMPIEMTGNVKTRVEGSSIQMAYDMHMLDSTSGTSTNISMWLKDGWQYMSMSGDELTVNVKAPAPEELAALEELDPVDLQAMDVSGLAMIDSISSKKSGSNTVYTLVIGKAMSGMMDSVNNITGSAESEDTPEIEIGEITASYTVNNRGEIKQISMLFSAAATGDMEMTDGTVLAMELAYDYDMTVTVNATGNAVKIIYPDFSDFVEITAEEMDQLA